MRPGVRQRSPLHGVTVPHMTDGPVVAIAANSPTNSTRCSQPRSGRRPWARSTTSHGRPPARRREIWLTTRSWTRRVALVGSCSPRMSTPVRTLRTSPPTRKRTCARGSCMVSNLSMDRPLRGDEHAAARHGTSRRPQPHRRQRLSLPTPANAGRSYWPTPRSARSPR